jgi:hypothetical protein
MPCSPFAPDDEKRLSATLTRFLPHTGAIALTGGVAIQMHCHDAGIGSPRRIADVDFVATSIDDIEPSVATDFLVSHFHLPHRDYPKFMIQLVDPATRLRIDVFPDLVGSIACARRQTVAGHRLRVLSACSILEHKLLGMSRASTARPIDEKHTLDAMILGQICGRRVDPLPTGALTKDAYTGDLSPCPRCNASRTSGFPVAPRHRVFEILGYS